MTARVQAGDCCLGSEFEDAIVGLMPRLRRFATGLTRDRDAADDLCQATLERALRQRHQWQQGSRIDSWMYRIMRNIWIDTLRAGQRRPVAVDADFVAEAIGVDGGQEASAQLGHIDRAMAMLPPEQREVVMLILVEGFGYAEAAEILNCPPGTVNSRLVRGRDRLMALLGEAA